MQLKTTKTPATLKEESNLSFRWEATSGPDHLWLLMILSTEKIYKFYFTVICQYYLSFCVEIFLLAWDFPVVSTENIFHKLQPDFENLMYVYPKVVSLIKF